ncbi:hypothetical protein RFI_30899 [Reticulomyxa filosa]|uniref:Uncharacterized protein n=1 Tax=Reticulomyxa filosa TaxID=46433 RepID=X6LX30_RETFI|nr:hypothetical protein RFI_30899 [Reticulomyxa filosa]|eukprot:ETO06493.1 hypothetical protein RFI_30899 [Reticulomyxa filosa]
MKQMQKKFEEEMEKEFETQQKEWNLMNGHDMDVREVADRKKPRQSPNVEFSIGEEMEKAFRIEIPPPSQNEERKNNSFSLNSHDHHLQLPLTATAKTPGETPMAFLTQLQLKQVCLCLFLYLMLAESLIGMENDATRQPSLDMRFINNSVRTIRDKFGLNEKDDGVDLEVSCFLKYNYPIVTIAIVTASFILSLHRTYVDVYALVFIVRKIKNDIVEQIYAVSGLAVGTRDPSDMAAVKVSFQKERGGSLEYNITERERERERQKKR